MNRRSLNFQLRRIGIPLVVILILVALILWLNTRMPKTTIELSVQAMSITFQTATRELHVNQRLFDVLRVNDFASDGLSSFAVGAEKPVTLDAGFDTLKLLASPDNRLTLSDVIVGGGTKVTLHALEEESPSLEVILEGNLDPITLFARGEIIIDSNQENQREPDDLGNGNFVSLVGQGEGDVRRIAMSFQPEAANLSLAPRVIIEGLNFDDSLDLTALEKPLFIDNSTVVEGKLYLEDIGGKELLLRPGEPLHFESLTGFLRKVTFENEILSLQMRAKVSGMATGEGDFRRNLMPTRLEWLLSQNSLIALLGGLLAVLSLIISIVSAFGFNKEN